MIKNEYIPFPSTIKEIIKHTDIEYTFRMSYEGEVKPGQFFEVSLPKFGEAPISVSGYTNDSVDLTIRKVGKVTDEIFENYVGDKLFLRGPYGNGFDIDTYKGEELLVVAGGTGLSPVRALVDHFATNIDEVKRLHIVAGFKSEEDILFIDDIKRWEKTSNLVLTLDKNENNYLAKTGLVTEHLPNISFDDISKTVAVVVGPPMMMHFTVLKLLEIGFKEENIWISHERKMCCGLGKCGHCKIGDTYVCLDGPVFKYTEGKLLID